MNLGVRKSITDRLGRLTFTGITPHDIWVLKFRFLKQPSLTSTMLLNSRSVGTGLMNASPGLYKENISCITKPQRITAACAFVQRNRWGFSPEGDAVEDDQQSDAPGSEWTMKQLSNGHQALQDKTYSKTQNSYLMTTWCKEQEQNKNINNIAEDSKRKLFLMCPMFYSCLICCCFFTSQHEIMQHHIRENRNK